MNGPSLHTKKLLLEDLESRRVLAGNVLASTDGALLKIVGDDSANGVTLTYIAATQTFRVTGRDAGGLPTTINGLDTSLAGNNVDFTGVKQVQVKLNGGNDDFSVGSPTAVDTVLANWMSVETGDGDDHVVVGAAGSTAVGSTPRALSLKTGGSLTVDLGTGNDTLSLANLDIGQSIGIVAGTGNDNVTFDTSYTPPVLHATPQLFPVKVKNNLNISLGAGTDVLVVSNVSVQNDMTILDGEGVANLTLFNLNVSKKFDINTSDGDDEIKLDLVRAKAMNINTNGGSDHVQIDRGTFGSLNIKLGAGRDHLRITGTKTTTMTNLDGGDRGATFVSTRNSLKAVIKRHF